MLEGLDVLRSALQGGPTAHSMIIIACARFKLLVGLDQAMTRIAKDM